MEEAGKPERGQFPESAPVGARFRIYLMPKVAGFAESVVVGVREREKRGCSKAFGLSDCTDGTFHLLIGKDAHV